jgi:hypothetical protein
MNEISTKINSIDNKANIPLSDRSFNKMKFDFSVKQMEVEKKFIVLPDLKNLNKDSIPFKTVEEINQDDTKVILTLKIIDIIPRNVIDFTYGYCSENQER